MGISSGRESDWGCAGAGAAESESVAASTEICNSRGEFCNFRGRAQKKIGIIFEQAVFEATCVGTVSTQHPVFAAHDRRSA